MSIDISNIKIEHAEIVLQRTNCLYEQGSLNIDGENVDWWSDGSAVWFYEPGKHGEDTIKRYDVQKKVFEA